MLATATALSSSSQPSRLAPAAAQAEGGGPSRSRAVAARVAVRGVEAPPAPRRQAMELNNVVVAPESSTRRAALEAEVRAQLELENGWWKDGAGAPANLATPTSKAEFKRLVLEAPPSQLVVVDYLKPSCGACRRLYPKLLQIAGDNQDALFLKVNVDLNEELAELGQGMGVTHLPWFHLFRGGQVVASFSANTTTISTLRAEIAAHKACTEPACAFH